MTIEKSDRLSFLWLAVAAILLLFTNGRWIIPIAPWLFAVFMIRFVRTQPVFRGLSIGYLVVVSASFLIWKGIIPFPGVMYFLYTGMIGTFFFLPFVLDRLSYGRTAGISATLVFPLAFTTQELLLSVATPGATWSSIAYTQYGQLALMQIVSIAGLGGLTFSIAWFAAVVSWAWDRGFVWQEVRRNVTVYAGIMIAVLLYGGARISLFEPEIRTVRVGSVNSAAGFRITDPVTSGLLDKDTTSGLMLEERDRLFERSLRAANAGAKIVFFQESGCRVFAEDESEYVLLGREFARREEIYLGMAMAVIPDGFPSERFTNKIVWIDPFGEIAAEYMKSNPAPGEGSVPGSGKIPVIDTPYGSIATSICFDMDFDHLINQAGKSNADIMIAPSMDWKEIVPLHTYMAVYRAIENGFSMIRGTGRGLSMAVDYHGTELARLNWFTSDDLVMISDVPTRGVSTVFAKVGRLFSWICAAALIGIMVWVVFRRRRDSGGST